MFQGTNGPENESSIMGTNSLGHKESGERMFLIPRDAFELLIIVASMHACRDSSIAQ